MILDMATPYDVVSGPNSQFAQIRDSLYLLGVMNQCTRLMNSSEAVRTWQTDWF